MSKLSYLARVMSGVRLKKMNQMIDVVHDKCGQNKVKTFFDMCWCGARYGAGYYDYVMFGFYNMNGRQRDTYLTRVRNKKVIDHMNDLSYSDEFDDKLRFNQRFAKYLGRKTLNGETATLTEFTDFIAGQEAIFAKINHGDCGRGVNKLYVKDYESPAVMLDYIRRNQLVVLEQVLPPIFAKYGTYNTASSAPFKRIAYNDAMERYGSDKPDLRIDLEVQDVTDLIGGCGFQPFEGNTVKAVVVSDMTATRKQIDKLCADVEVVTANKVYWFKLDEKGEIAGGIAKFVKEQKDELVEKLGLKPNTFVGLTCGKKLAAQKTAGVLRRLVADLCPAHIDREKYEFCWIVDFPMYEIGEESGELEFCHNPFSMPNGGLEILQKAAAGEVDPLTITAYQYDLVCNGVELSSGAVRNHDPEIMIEAFKLVRLGEEDVKAKFPAMYNAFCYGAPPHAGIAPGVDRMVMLLAGAETIREVIPFPMNKNAQDVMMGAPGKVDQKQLDELHIACTKVEE